MKKLIYSVLFLSLVGALMVVPASAVSTTLYASGNPNGTIGAWEVDGSGNWVSDLFTDTHSGTAIDATFAVWLSEGDTMSSVKWALSSGKDDTGTSYGSGTASTVFDGYYTSGFQADNGLLGVTEFISLSPSVVLTAGHNYYFTLWGATGTGIAADGAF